MFNVFLKKENLYKSIYFGLFISLAILAPVFRNKIIVGTIVNTCLILSVYKLGIKPTIIIGIVPSLIALTTGVVPMYLALIIPFIMVSNTILIDRKSVV